ncbi:Lsr2 family protein [Nocardia sp. NPDC050697]|uniref:histone-like nucleoid-structuring protein Lsr2 n=1 Tax=Nocardia sp. NPDC050697 TaxID=3155158 RepID=UPI0034010627
MGKKVDIQWIDDFDGRSPAAETVRFSVDGAEFEIDLSAANADLFRGMLQLWKSRARRVREVRSGPPETVREWAHRNGYRVEPNGRVSAKILRAYRDAADSEGRGDEAGANSAPTPL